MLTLVKYDEQFLAKSYVWLKDEEIRSLIDGPLVLTHDIQQEWYTRMLADHTYQIWGIDWNGVAIGACGIKHIDFSNKVGEYWGYIGEKQYWGGKGHILMNNVFQKAQDLGLNKLYLLVLTNNERAFQLYKSEGFIIDKREDNRIYMSKQL